MDVIRDKVSITSLAAGSAEIPLPRKSVRRIIFGARYTVTDAGIAAGENLNGWLDSIQIYGDNKLLFRADRDEMDDVVSLLAAYGTDSPEDPEDLDMVSNASLSSDATPTTAEVQRAWYVLNFPHDFRQYKTAKVVVAWRAATDEWGGATAMSATFFIGLQYGNVPRSLAVTRTSMGSSTQQDIPMGDFPVIGMLFIGPAANTYDEIHVAGKDGFEDVNVDEPIVGQAIYNMLTGSTPADDDVDFFMSEPVLIANYAERKAHVTLTAASALVAFFLGIVADAMPPKGATKGEVARGTAPAETRQFTGAHASATLTGLGFRDRARNLIPI